MTTSRQGSSSDEELGKTLAATDHQVTDERVSLPVMFFRGAGEARYERERVLGEGGMGIVELHKDKRIGRSVAMKILRSDYVDSTSQRRFLHEAQLQGQLEHPAIVPVYDIGEDKDGFFFTMKRVRGITLHDIVVGLRMGNEAFTDKYSRRKLLAAFSQVCLAIDFAHTHGVLHRDLKPANIMLGDFGEVYVLDWGIAKIVGATDEASVDTPMPPLAAPPTMAGSVLGTPAYMAPEQLKGEEVDRTADVYALGAILYELLSLEPLHKRGLKLDQIMAATFAAGDRRPSVRSPDLEIAPELDEVVTTALALDPEQRYARARHVHEAIERYLDGERDLELRHERSKQHLEAAMTAIREVTQGSPDNEIDARRRAMVEIGQAIAQDPKNVEALEVLDKLLNTDARVSPPEVTGAMEYGELQRLKRISLLGAKSYLAVWAFFPLIWWMGIREPWPMIGLFTGLTLAGISSLVISRRKAPSPNVVLLPLIASNLGFGCIAGMLGPLVFVPTVAVVNTVAFTIHARRVLRTPILAIGLATFVLPFVLELAGALPRSYGFGMEGMTILTRGLDLEQTPTLVVVFLAQVLAVSVGVWVVSIMRDYIDVAERRVYTYAWHLREWIPDSHKRKTDPVNRRRTRPVQAVKP